MAPYVHGLIELAAQQQISLIPVSPAISMSAATMEWSHRDPFDRLICATAITEHLTLISADKVFDDPAVAAALQGIVH